MAVKVLRYFRNNTLRPFCLSTPPFMQCSTNKEGGTDMSGFIGSELTHLLNILKWKFQHVSGEEVDPSRSMGTNSDWGGTYALFEQKKLDVVFLPSSMVGFEDTSNRLPFTFVNMPFSQESFRILSFNNLTESKPELLSSLVSIYPLGIWIYIIAIFMSFIFISLITPLLLFKMRRQMCSISWKIMGYLINQKNICPFSLPTKIIVATLALFYFLVIKCYFCSLMSTDKVAVDTSKIVQNLEDILRVNKTPALFVSDPASRRYWNEKDSNSIYSRIYAKMKEINDESKTNFEMKPSFSGIRIKDGNVALISRKFFIQMISCIWCYKDMAKGLNRQQYLSPVDSYSHPMYFCKRVNMSVEANAAIDDLVYRFLEGDLHEAIRSHALSEFQNTFLRTSRNTCLKTSLSAVTQEIKDKNISSLFLSIFDVKLLFLYLFMCLLFSAALLIIEIVFNKCYIIAKLRKRNRQTLPHKLFESGLLQKSGPLRIESVAMKVLPQVSKKPSSHQC